MCPIEFLKMNKIFDNELSKWPKYYGIYLKLETLMLCYGKWPIRCENNTNRIIFHKVKWSDYWTFNIHYKPILLGTHYLLGDLLPSSDFFLQWASLIGHNKKSSERSIHLKHRKCKSLCPPTYIGSKRMMTLGKAIGQSEVLLGTCWETYWEIGEHVENPVRTWWEHLGTNNKNPTQSGSLGIKRVQSRNNWLTCSGEGWSPESVPTECQKVVSLVGTRGWSELAATNAPVADEPVEAVFRMNENPILPARIFYFFFHLFSTPKFSPLLPTIYLPPPTYHLPPPPPLTPSPELQRRWAGASLERERAWSLEPTWSGSELGAGASLELGAWSGWSRTHIGPR